jgi:hypothetical protein
LKQVAKTMPNICMERTRRLRSVSMLNVYWRRVADARRCLLRIGTAPVQFSVKTFKRRPSGAKAFTLIELQDAMALPTGQN